MGLGQAEHRSIRFLLGGTRLTIAVLSLMIGVSFGQKAQPNPLAPKARVPVQLEQPPQSGRHEITADDIEAFLDGVIPLQLARENIAGAVIAVVKDGKVLFSKGYGYADVEKKVPVSPDTLFRVASITKLFTWTAVMQLVEKGRLDLDRDVNDYLDFTVPHTFGKPVTLRDLMTHTPGFEDEAKDSEMKKGRELLPVRAFLVDHLPRQIFAPGTITAYSNCGAVLAGYIVQRVSNQSYADYIDKNIFQPLSMSHATVLQPVPKDLEPLMSKGYGLASEGPKPFELLAPEPAPDGSLSMSGIEISHFMTAHLQDGQYEGERILEPKTAQLMHTRQFTMDPAVNGMALGFYEENRNGLRIIGHGGDLNYFHSDLHLLPDARIGFFVSYNSAGKADPRPALWENFLDRYFPSDPIHDPSTNSAQDAASVSGMYISSRREQTTILAPVWYLATQASVSSHPDGTIEVDQITGTDDKPKRWRGIGNLVFREVNGHGKLVFKKGPAGELDMVGDDPTFIRQRVPWNTNSYFLRAVIVLVLVIFAATLSLWPVAAIVRRHYQARLNLDQVQRRLRLLVKLVIALDLIFLLSLGGIVAYGIARPTILGDALDPWLRVIQMIGLLGAVGTLLIIYNSYVSWRDAAVGLWMKAYSTGLVLACFAYVWLIWKFNLLQVSLSY